MQHIISGLDFTNAYDALLTLHNTLNPLYLTRTHRNLRTLPMVVLGCVVRKCWGNGPQGSNEPWGHPGPWPPVPLHVAVMSLNKTPPPKKKKKKKKCVPLSFWSWCPCTLNMFSFFGHCTLFKHVLTLKNSYSNPATWSWTDFESLFVVLSHPVQPFWSVVRIRSARCALLFNFINLPHWEVISRQCDMASVSKWGCYSP